ncbi:MAG: hypothetical protein DVB22_000885 [Verrucomicrobia bacterium]|nr:MAG: hypothetical protein DVB22_000885 [Verrucomicrobiota bacterium]
MTLLTIAAFLALAAASHADETVAAKATSGRFQITQEYHEYQGDKGDQGEFVETVRFADTTLPSVRLSGMPWPGNYHISPDEHWLLRTQKTGSGESIAMLYHIEENGRVSEVIGFDDLLWNVFDSNSPVRKKELYHNRVSEAAWADDSATLTIVLKGTEASSPGDDIECPVIYNLKTNKALLKPSSSKPDTKSPP